MNQQTQNLKNRFIKIILITIIILPITIILSLAGLTKVGYIPNFLNIEILCPNKLNINTLHPNQNENPFGAQTAKPVIYLYPNQKQDISVKLDYAGKIFADYPEYNKSIGGWNVTAYPDGHLVNKFDNKEYSYLFWEGTPAITINWDISKGFVIEGKNTREFLQNILSKIGLTPKEYNEFIVYWYPIMKDNKYNLITFADKQYTEIASLTISPKPDSILRVFMAFKSLDKKLEIEPQNIKTFERKGFTVVEWGGTKIN